MHFFTQLKSYLPDLLTPTSRTLFTRASFGAMAAYSATINPIVSVLVLLGHGAWECADLLMDSTISLQQQRINSYNAAFLQLHERALQLGTECSPEELMNAKNIFMVHNLIEEICYTALSDTVIELNLRGDSITEAQSGYILAKVKEAAHVELRKEGGYVKKGREMITPAQIDGVIKNVAPIIHDRDGRLTDARYFSLSDLCTALDDHNSFVKNTLFHSWFRCKSLFSTTHLTMIKNIVRFNERMSEQVGFDFAERLAEKKHYYDTNHQNIREVVCSKSGTLSALRFVNVTEVRARFNDDIINRLMLCDAEQPLAEGLQRRLSFSVEEVTALMKARSVSCPARFGFSSDAKKIHQPALLKENITVGDFLRTYFPERIKSGEPEAVMFIA